MTTKANKTTRMTTTKPKRRSYRELCLSVWLPRPIRNQTEYGKALKAIEAVLTNRPTVDEHTYLDLVAGMIEDYEKTLFEPPEKLNPTELINHLCELNGLSPGDLSKLLGDKHRAIGPRLLSGERKPSKRHAHLLATRFKLDVGAFL